MNKSFLALGNLALKNKYYEEAISYYTQAKTIMPELSPMLERNIQRVKRLGNLNNGHHSLSGVEMKETDPILLRLETTTTKSATGWAISEIDKNKIIYVQLNLNEKPLHIVDTNRMRGDVKKVHGGDGFSGFIAELNEYLDFDGNSNVSVSPINGILAKNNKPEHHLKLLGPTHKGEHFTSINSRSKKLIEKNISNLKLDYDRKIINPLVSIVILNLNGIDVLPRCINSIIEFTKCSYEIILIDHGSIDGSIEYIKSIKNKRIKVFLRGSNYSFSASNNFAAKHAKGDALVFMNNDMIIVDDVISKMADACRYSDYGLVGVKLWDMPQGLPVEKSISLKIIQHIGVHFKDTHRTHSVEAYESRPGVFFDINSGVYDTPAVTAALVCITAADFTKINGFNEKYFYGQEDVDLCLKYIRADLRKTGVLLDVGAFHARGLSRRILSTRGSSYLNENRDVLQKEQANWFKRYLRATKLEKSGYWNPKPYSIAMIVSDISFETDKADYFTARELGDALERDQRIVVGYFSEANKEIDVNGYDAVIVFIDGFNPSRLINLSPNVILIAWARNWFDRWCERTWIHTYDMVFASSLLACDYMKSCLQKHVGLLRIAASQACIDGAKYNEIHSSDYCFTGSYFGSPREIAEQLNPNELSYNFHLYGHSWESHPNFSKFTKGPVAYTDIPHVYASTKIVIDDANIATKKWGALNCRIYDSLAAGALCITNNKVGIDEIFESDYPFYDGKKSLHTKIDDLLQNENGRDFLKNKYRNKIINSHTYSHRSIQLKDEIRNFSKKIKIAIKISAPEMSKAKGWGDLYFALGLAKHFEIEGYAVRIDCIDQWYTPRSLADDVVINLRGLSRYKTRSEQFNILWIISHPDMVCIDEVNEFDKVYVASEFYAKKLMDFSSIDHVETLLQASDFSVDLLDFEKIKNTPQHDILFIGNSRNQYRDVVRWCVENKLAISVYGQGWSSLIDEKYIVSEYVDNRDIPYLYKNSKVVLNDHWPDMKKYGFISNRVWDVLSSGGVVLSDYVYGMDSIKSNRLHTFKNESEFMEKIKFCLKIDSLGSSSFINESFHDRAKFISIEILKNLS
jgi:GT2 family glycosyltransferase/spore maturation protein CgeB